MIKLYKIDKTNEKKPRYSPFLIVSEAAQNLSFFLINCLSIFYHFPRKQRKMNKNYQKMMKNDKKLIKKMKKLETLIIFCFFEPSQGGVWGWGEVCQAGVCQGRSARGVLGEVCARGGLQGRSARGVLGEVCARGDVWGGMGGLPGEVCQGKLGRLAGEVCQVCTNMINWQLINQINKLYLCSFYGILWSDVQLVIKPNTFS